MFQLDFDHVKKEDMVIEKEPIELNSDAAVEDVYKRQLSIKSLLRSKRRKSDVFSALAGARFGVPSLLSPATTLISPVFSSRTRCV